ncbi:MAG: type II toxin-antitoxin system PemK/MazF family toxin [Anaerolineales bacterium]|nr:type II toxin-antitoxin system PemK/MazF family toxin [Anaerolineales bacterium]
MPSFSKGDVVLVRYPFSDLSATKIRPAVVVHAPHSSQDNLIVPLTSRVTALSAGEFALDDWEIAGLNVPTAVKRGVYTVHPSLVIKRVGALSDRDVQGVDRALRMWLAL